MDGKHQSDKQKIMAIYDQLPDEVRLIYREEILVLHYTSWL